MPLPPYPPPRRALPSLSVLGLTELGDYARIVVTFGFPRAVKVVAVLFGLGLVAVLTFALAAQPLVVVVAVLAFALLVAFFGGFYAWREAHQYALEAQKAYHGVTAAVRQRRDMIAAVQRLRQTVQVFETAFERSVSWDHPIDIQDGKERLRRWVDSANAVAATYPDVRLAPNELEVPPDEDLTTPEDIIRVYRELMAKVDNAAPQPANYFFNLPLDG